MNVGKLIQEGKTGTVVEVVTQRVPQFRDGDDNQYLAPVLYVDFFLRGRLHSAEKEQRVRNGLYVAVPDIEKSIFNSTLVVIHTIDLDQENESGD